MIFWETERLVQTNIMEGNEIDDRDINIKKNFKQRHTVCKSSLYRVVVEILICFHFNKLRTGVSSLIIC